MASLPDTHPSLFPANGDDDNNNNDAHSDQPNSSSHQHIDPSTVVQGKTDVIVNNVSNDTLCHNHSYDINKDATPDAKPGDDGKGRNSSKVKSRQNGPPWRKLSRKELPFSMKEVLALPTDDLKSVAETNPKLLAAELRKAYKDLDNPKLLPQPPGKRARNLSRSRLVRVVSRWKFRLYDPSESLRVRLGLDPPFKCASANTTSLWREKRRRGELGDDTNVDQERPNNGDAKPLPRPDNDENTRPSKVPRFSTSDAVLSDEPDVVRIAQTSENATMAESRVLPGNHAQTSEIATLPESQMFPGNRDDSVTSHHAGSFVTFESPVQSHGETHPACDPGETRTE